MHLVGRQPLLHEDNQLPKEIYQANVAHHTTQRVGASHCARDGMAGVARA